MYVDMHHVAFDPQEGLETGAPGTDDGRFYFHLGDALQRVGDQSVSIIEQS